MLVLSRRKGESIVIGDIEIFVVDLNNVKVKLGFDAPPDVRIFRKELLRNAVQEKIQGSDSTDEGATQ